MSKTEIYDASQLDAAICATQGRIYAYAVELGYNLESFSNLYLKSDFCRREFDTIYSHYHLELANECMDIIKPEIGPYLQKGKTEYDKAAHMIGYMYRQLYMKTSVPSAELCDIIPFSVIAEDAFSFDHYGIEYFADEYIRTYSLPVKPYDSDFIPMSEKEMQKIRNMKFEDTVI